jgi:hypothetical protein
MRLVLDVPSELGAELAAEATQLGLPLQEYVLRVLAGGRIPNPAPRTGAELVACWQAAGLVGTRSELADSLAHARAPREQAQRRARP